MRFADAPPADILMVSDATLRDYFAAHAPFTMADAVKGLTDDGVKKLKFLDVLDALVGMRMMYAETMMKERAK